MENCIQYDLNSNFSDAFEFNNVLKSPQTVAVMKGLKTETFVPFVNHCPGAQLALNNAILVTGTFLLELNPR
jgi:hypothetical protein